MASCVGHRCPVQVGTTELALTGAELDVLVESTAGTSSSELFSVRSVQLLLMKAIEI